VSASDDIARSVLDAARAAYAARGYLGTTLKGVAAASGVAPDVLRRYYDDREALFVAAMRLPIDPSTSIAQLLAPGMDGLGDRLVRVTLRLLDDDQTREQLTQLMTAGAGAVSATSSLREFLDSAVVDRVAGALGVPDARLRVSLAMSYLIGVAASRYVLRMEPLASATEDQVVAMVGPAVQAALTTPIPMVAPESE